MNKPSTTTTAFNVVGKYKRESLFSKEASLAEAKNSYLAKTLNSKVINRDLETTDGAFKGSVEVEQEEICEGEVVLNFDMVERATKSQNVHTITELMLSNEKISLLNKNN